MLQLPNAAVVPQTLAVSWLLFATVKQQSRKKTRREIFVLTPDEKRTICFVLIAFVLGLATKQYRAAQAVSPPQAAVDQTITTASHPTEKRAESKRAQRPQ